MTEQFFPDEDDPEDNDHLVCWACGSRLVFVNPDEWICPTCNSGAFRLDPQEQHHDR